jgi:hypothetical protein
MNVNWQSWKKQAFAVTEGQTFCFFQVKIFIDSLHMAGMSP